MPAASAAVNATCPRSATPRPVLDHSVRARKPFPRAGRSTRARPAPAEEGGAGRALPGLPRRRATRARLPRADGRGGSVFQQSRCRSQRAAPLLYPTAPVRSRSSHRRCRGDAASDRAPGSATAPGGRRRASTEAGPRAVSPVSRPPPACRRLSPLRRAACRSASRRARSRTPRCRTACRQPCRAPAPGDMYAAVPRITPAAVARPVSVGECVRDGEEPLVPSKILARPKSRSLTLPSRRHLDVGGLEIAVDDALLVRGLERLGDLPRDRERFIERNRSARRFGRPSPRLRRAPSPRMCRPATCLEGIDRRDAGVIERRERFRLALEAGDAVRVLEELLRQHLERDVAPELRVPGPVDLPHPARAERRDDVVGTEARSDSESQSGEETTSARVSRLGSSSSGPGRARGDGRRGRAGRGGIPRGRCRGASRPAVCPSSRRSGGSIGACEAHRPPGSA